MPFDFEAAVAAPFRMQPGLRRLAEGATQLTPQPPGSRHQREKLAVLSAFAAQALVAQPGFDPHPALSVLCAQAAAEHPQAWGWDGRRAAARLLATAVDGEQVEVLGAGHFGLGDKIARCLHALPGPWRLAGLLSLAFAEDFAIVDGDSGRLPWMAVALPSHWAPEHKVGRHFAEVHAPVADNDLLIKAGESLMRLVTGPQRWERFVWNVTDHPRLHAHPDRMDDTRWQDTPIERAWWRTERQTFIPVPSHRQAVFTIEVQVMPLAQAIDTRARAARLHDAVATMSASVQAYRGLTAVHTPLLDWLAARE